MKTILLVRHPSVLVDKQMCYGFKDVAANETEHAAILEHMKKYVSDDVKVFSSPLSRCKNLANSFSDEVSFDDRLKEMNFGDWEGESWKTISKSKEGQFWMNNFVEQNTPNGESFIDLIDRVNSFIYELMVLKNETIVVFAHGGVIRAVLVKLLELNPENVFRLKIDYGSVTSISIVDKLKTIDFINRV